MFEQALNFEFSDLLGQFTATQHTRRSTCNLHRDFNGDGFVFNNFQEVHMQQLVGYRVELGFLKAGAELLTAEEIAKL